jgi:hypothetical protein
MRCLSCQQEVKSADAKVVLKVYLCGSCGELAKKAEKELDAEIENSRQVAKQALAEHIMQGGLLRPRGHFEQEEITKELPISTKRKTSQFPKPEGSK